MDSLLMIFLGVLAVAINYCSAGVIPAAPLVAAPAAVAVPYDVPPHVSRIDINSKSIFSPLLASSPIFGAPAAVAASPVFSAPPTVAGHPASVVAAYPAPAAVTAPIVAGNGFIQPTYGSSLISPFTYDPAFFG